MSCTGTSGYCCHTSDQACSAISTILPSASKKVLSVFAFPNGSKIAYISSGDVRITWPRYMAESQDIPQMLRYGSRRHLSHPYSSPCVAPDQLRRFSTCNMSFTRIPDPPILNPVHLPFFTTISPTYSLTCCKGRSESYAVPSHSTVERYVRICSTDCCLVDLDLHLIRSYFRNRNTLHPRSFLRFSFTRCPRRTIII